jgi:hypothetical protein
MADGKTLSDIEEKPDGAAKPDGRTNETHSF